MRVARETYVLLARFGDDTVKKRKGGAARLPLSFLYEIDFESVMHRRLVVVAVMLGVGALVMVAIMRGCLVGRLRLCGTRAILRSRLHGRCLLRGHKQNQC